MDSSEPVRWGILSTARINASVIPGLHESPLAEPLAVASRSAQRATAHAREWGIPRAYGRYDELLDDPDVEAVYVSLPNGQHGEWSSGWRGRSSRTVSQHRSTARSTSHRGRGWT